MFDHREEFHALFTKESKKNKTQWLGATQPALAFKECIGLRKGVTISSRHWFQEFTITKYANRSERSGFESCDELPNYS